MTTDLIFWGDVESTGTDPHRGYLLQIAGFLTDLDLNIISEPFDHIIQHTNPHIRDYAVPFVQNMHDATGLWDRLPAGTPLEEVDELVKNYINSYKVDDNTVIRLAGNSLRLDLNFIEKFLPETYSTLTYRSLDMSAVAFFMRQVCGIVEEDFDKKKSHNAIDDVMESLEECRWFRDKATNLMPPL